MRESEMQSELMKWAGQLSVVYPELELINASLNGIVTTAKIKNMMKGQGMKKGYRFADLGWILEDNELMNRELENMGAKIYKRYRVYEMAI